MLRVEIKVIAFSTKNHLVEFGRGCYGTRLIARGTSYVYNYAREVSPNFYMKKTSKAYNSNYVYTNFQFLNFSA